MNEIIIRKIKKIRKIKRLHWIPNFIYPARNNRPVRSSTAGYSKEIFVWQLRHFPFNKKKLTNGILSFHFIGIRHFGQCEAGFTIDLLYGIRRITTFAKEPKNVPRIKKNNPII
ncbi:MAG: hypothetical protein V1833_03595 [Elusimicrobiota bacterium]